MYQHQDSEKHTFSFSFATAVLWEMSESLQLMPTVPHIYSRTWKRLCVRLMKMFVSVQLFIASTRIV